MASNYSDLLKSEYAVYLEKLSSNLGLMNWKACMRVTVSWVRIPSFPPLIEI